MTQVTIGNPPDPKRQTRERALELAVQWANAMGRQSSSAIRPPNVVSAAQRFEQYLERGT